MITGSFEIWEFAVLVAGAVEIITVGFFGNYSGLFPEAIAVYIGFVLMIAMLFVRPLWLLINRKRIKSLEHTAAVVTEKARQKFSSARSIINYKTMLTLSFSSQTGQRYNETFLAPAFMKRAEKDDKYEIAFDPKNPKELIVLEPARKLAAVMTISGIILEAAVTVLWIVEFVLDK